MRKVDPSLVERLEKLISSMGCELFACEFAQDGGRVIFRILIDREQGITIDDCSLVSHQVSAMLDVEDLVQGRYALEVSSPGIDRPLFTIKHYQKYIGSRVKVRLHVAVDGRRQYKGVLVRAEDESICLLVDDSNKEVILPFSAIEKANVIGDVRL